MQALILLDLQNDYGIFGALPIAGAEELISKANLLMTFFPITVATQDWHPANHISFAANHPWRHPDQQITVDGMEQKLSIIHCAQNTFGAELMGGLNIDGIEKVFVKGTDPKVKRHSTFFDHEQKIDTGLDKWLKTKEITTLYLMGLSYENSIKHSAIDAVKLGFKCKLIEDGIMGIPDQALESFKKDMLQAGVKFVHSSNLI